ncbi:MAG: glycosyltransferase family 39 protein [Sedimentisphaerales bacterium]|jgi:4-amino-4-deoxy-L-arabinose transferase-like glycosyltransferase
MTERVSKILVVTALAVLSLAMLANSMTKPVARDEQMYCSGAILLAQGEMIYKDFSYAAQMPYHPLLCAALFKLFGTTYYLLVVRLLSCACDILVMVCIVAIYRRIFKPFATTGVLLGLAAAILYAFNPLVGYANGYAWNHDVVILCVVLSLWLFVSRDVQKKPQYWRLAAIGALLTFATFMRVTTVLVELLFFVVVLSLPAKSIKQRLKTALPFVAASVVLMIWPLWVIAQAPRAFFLDLVKVPMLYGRWLQEIGMVHNKAALTFACLTTPAYFILLLLTIYLCLAGLFLRHRLKIADARNLWLAALLPIVFFVIALIPPTMWRQYLAIPVPFLAIGLAFPLSYLRRLGPKGKVGKHFKIGAVSIALGALIAVLSYPVVLYRTLMVVVPERWAPVELHGISKDIVAKTKEPKQILTLAPLLALEGGGKIYTQLSAGAIIYRIADSLSPEERQITHTAGPKELPELIEEIPPSAVILGVEMPRLEEPIFKLVVRPDWKREDYENGPTVYFRP